MTGYTIDRDEATEAVRAYRDGEIDHDTLLDRLAGCVRPAAIDRDALMEAFRFMPEEYRTSATDWVLALVRPVAGITLTLRERSLLATAAESMARKLELVSETAADRDATDLRALAARLEAIS